MTFTKHLRRGEITCTVRFWLHPRVRVGARIAWRTATSRPIRFRPSVFPDITPELVRESGFLGVLDLLKVAKHGRGENIYLIQFH